MFLRAQMEDTTLLNNHHISILNFADNPKIQILELDFAHILGFPLHLIRA